MLLCEHHGKGHRLFVVMLILLTVPSTAKKIRYSSYGLGYFLANDLSHPDGRFSVREIGGGIQLVDHKRRYNHDVWYLKKPITNLSVEWVTDTEWAMDTYILRWYEPESPWDPFYNRYQGKSKVIHFCPQHVDMTKCGFFGNRRSCSRDAQCLSGRCKSPNGDDNKICIALGDGDACSFNPECTSKLCVTNVCSPNPKQNCDDDCQDRRNEFESAPVRF